jgi:hypothetical protein
VIAFQRFLVDEILVRGSRILVEHLLRNAEQPWDEAQQAEFFDKLRDHIAGNVCQGLARKVGYQMTPDAGMQHEALIRQSLTFLADLLTADPPGRLLIPLADSPFDPQRHEPIAGRPASGELKVTAMLFPGYLIRGNPERVEEKARVYTERIGGK